MRYYLDDIITNIDIYSVDILLDKKIYKNVCIL